MNVENNTENFIGDVELLEREYQHRFKKEVYKISNWNADSQLSAKMLKKYDADDDITTLDYILPYEIDIDLKERVLDKICGPMKSLNKDILFTTSGTTSIYALINIFKQQGKKRIAIVAPVYFTVMFVCKNLGIDYCIFYLKRNSEGFYLDEIDINNIKKCDVVWITNPIYCTGVYYGDREIDIFSEFLKTGITVVFDESLALWGDELIRKFNCYDNVISICSPHKSICINSIKFSCVIANKQYVQLMGYWSDIISGCLSWSNYKAIHHFLSENYNEEKDIFCEDTKNGFIKVREICQKYEIEYDRSSKGCFMTLYLSDIKYDYLDNFENLKELIMKGGVSLIMGSRNYFSPEFGLAIRVNLTNITKIKISKIIKMIILLRKNGCGEKMSINEEVEI